MEINRIGVVGAGKMGNSIALSAALAGYQVFLQNRTAANLEKARIGIETQLQKLVAKSVISEEQRAAAQVAIQMTSTYEHYDTLDFVIEVVAESLEVKNPILAKLDAICPQAAIIVSSTSTFSITGLAKVTQRPEQFAGMHFFIAPAKLVEITRGYYTSDATVAAAKEVGGRMGKVCIEIKKDSPGFIANRIYTPLFLEAFKVYEAGLASKEEIDLALKNTYLPIGPFELADIIGLDILSNSLDYYQSELGPAWTPPLSLKQMVRAGRLGKKSGKGWYDYL